MCLKKKKKSKQDTTTSFETLSKTTSGLKKNHWYQSFAPSSLLLQEIKF